MCYIYARTYGATCFAIQRPHVVYEKMGPGIYGWYRGGNKVAIREGLSEEKRKAVLVHEYTHYLDWVLGRVRVPGRAAQMCRSEERAWRVEGIYSAKDNSRWWRGYPYCIKYYA